MNTRHFFAAATTLFFATFATASNSEQNAEGETSTAGQRTNTFCATQKGAICEIVEATVETGVVDGIRYRLYVDSAGVATAPDADINDYKQPQWDIGCSRDKMSGVKSCSIRQGELWIFFRSAGSSIVSVGHDHYPRSISSLKIGKKRFDTRNQDGDFGDPQSIIKALADGQPVVTRFMKWPYREWKDDEFNSTGFRVATKLANWLLKNGKFK